MNNKLTILFAAFALYFLSAGISYFVFGSVLSKNPIAPSSSLPKLTQSGTVSFDQDLPKTQECPLNGIKYSRQQEAWWKTHGPLGVMIENHTEARPQSGLSKADTIYEIVAEGGITRFLVIYYCQDAGIVGPIRSARTYFIDFASEYGEFPLYAHVGGANQPGPADAISQLGTYGWAGYNDLDQFGVRKLIYKRDISRLPGVATEHTMYSTTTDLWNYAATNKDIKLTNVDKDGNPWDKNFVQYKFTDDPKSSERASSQSINIEYWNNSEYFVDWAYDSKGNIYKRENGGQPHLDKNFGKQLTAKNIVVLFMRESNANDGYENNVHLLYGTKGSGKAIVFKDGKRINATWKKQSRTSRTILTDSAGKEVIFNRGLIWFHVLATDGTVNVK